MNQTVEDSTLLVGNGTVSSLPLDTLYEMNATNISFTSCDTEYLEFR